MAAFLTFTGSCRGKPSEDLAGGRYLGEFEFSTGLEKTYEIEHEPESGLSNFKIKTRKKLSTVRAAHVAAITMYGSCGSC